MRETPVNTGHWSRRLTTKSTGMAARLTAIPVRRGYAGPRRLLGLFGELTHLSGHRQSLFGRNRREDFHVKHIVPVG